MTKPPLYRRNMDDAPRTVAVLASSRPPGDCIPLHVHRRGQLTYAVSGIMRVETPDAAWILPPARALWLPPQWPHTVIMRSHVEMRTVYIDEPHCTALPQQPRVFVDPRVPPHRRQVLLRCARRHNCPFRTIPAR